MKPITGIVIAVVLFFLLIGYALYTGIPSQRNVKAEIIQLENNLCVVFIQRGNVNTVLKVDCPKGGDEK